MLQLDKYQIFGDIGQSRTIYIPVDTKRYEYILSTQLNIMVDRNQD